MSLGEPESFSMPMTPIQHEPTYAILAELQKSYSILLFQNEEARDKYMDMRNTYSTSYLLGPIGHQELPVHHKIKIELEPVSYKRIVTDSKGIVHKDCDKDCFSVLHRKPISEIIKK
jgi:hypothetical protein